MRNASNELIKAYERSAKFYQTAHITFSNGQEKDLGRNDFYISGNSFSDSAASSSFPLGIALEKQVVLSIVNDYDQFSDYDFINAKIRIYCKYDLPSRTEAFLFGTFTVREPESYGTIITLTAVDDMYKGDKNYETAISFPASLGKILRDSCSTCGVSLFNINISNDDYIIQEIPTNITHRALWGLCAMLAGGNARMDQYNRLCIIQYDMSGFENDLDGGIFDSASPYASGDNADGGLFNPWNEGYDYDGNMFDTFPNIHVLFKAKNLTVSTDDVVITGIKTIVDEEEYISGSEGYILKVENQLISKSPQDAVNRIGNILIGLRFRPFQMDHVSYPFAEFGDLCYVIDRRQNIYKSVITDIDFNFFSYTTIKCSADSPLRNSSHYYSSDSETIVKSKRLTEKKLTNYDIAVQNLTTLITQSFGIFKTEEILDDGSSIFCLHDKPELAESKTIWKITADAFAVSTDGGKTWNAGIDSSGNAVVNVLSAIGINAEWVNTRGLTAWDNYGNITFEVNEVTGAVTISATSFKLSGKTINQLIESGIQSFDNSLTQEEIFNKLTNNGAEQGLYLKNGRIYLNFTYAVGGALVLGGSNNGNGTLKVVNASGNEIGKWDKDGISATSGTFSGKILASKGTIGGFTIGSSKIYGGNSETGVAVMQLPSENTTWVFAAGGKSHENYSDCPFRVSKEGKMYALNGVFSGELSAAKGTFSGTLSAAKGIFNGALEVNATKKNGENPVRIKVPDTYKDSSGVQHTFYVYFCAGNDGFVIARNRPGNRQFIRMYVGSGDGVPMLSGGTYSSFDEDSYTIMGEDEKLKIHSDGEIKTAWAYENTGSGIANVHISSQGVLQRTGSSSRRYKRDESTNLEEFEIENLYKVPVKKFKYKEGYLADGDPGIDKPFLGFIVEDLVKYFPAAVVYEDENPETWNDRVMIPSLLKLVQEQHKKILRQEKAIKKLNGRLEKLESVIYGGGNRGDSDEKRKI